MGLNNNSLDKKTVIKSKELRKSKEMELLINDYIEELGKTGELKNIFQFTKEMANIIIFLSENDRDGTLFHFITDYLTKTIDKGKIIRQEKGI